VLVQKELAVTDCSFPHPNLVGLDVQRIPLSLMLEHELERVQAGQELRVIRRCTAPTEISTPEQAREALLCLYYESDRKEHLAWTAERGPELVQIQCETEQVRLAELKAERERKERAVTEVNRKRKEMQDAAGVEIQRSKRKWIEQVLRNRQLQRVLDQSRV